MFKWLLLLSFMLCTTGCNTVGETDPGTFYTGNAVTAGGDVFAFEHARIVVASEWSGSWLVFDGPNGERIFLNKSQIVKVTITQVEK